MACPKCRLCQIVWRHTDIRGEVHWERYEATLVDRPRLLWLSHLCLSNWEDRDQDLNRWDAVQYQLPVQWSHSCSGAMGHYDPRSSLAVDHLQIVILFQMGKEAYLLENHREHLTKGCCKIRWKAYDLLLEFRIILPAGRALQIPDSYRRLVLLDPGWLWLELHLGWKGGSTKRLKLR